MQQKFESKQNIKSIRTTKYLKILIENNKIIKLNNKIIEYSLGCLVKSYFMSDEWYTHGNIHQFILDDA